MLLTVLQPSYFFPQSDFAKALQADVVVWADNFHFRRHGTINRAAIKSAQGMQWLTVPVISHGKSGQSIAQTKILQQEKWPATHRKTIEINYHITPYYDFYQDSLDRVWQKNWFELNPLLLQVFEIFAPARLLAILKAAGELTVCSDRTERIRTWMRQLDADSYLLWPHELALIDVSRLQEAGIALYSFDFYAPEYQQSFGKFMPNLSVLDLMCNNGPASHGLLRQAGKIKKL